MAEAASTPRWITRFAIATAVCTFFLVFAGGLVTSKGAGLAVPDWPLSYGRLMPEGWFRAENVRAEHSHRMIAGVVGLLTLGLALSIRRKESRAWVRNFAWLTVLMVAVQAILGGVVVLYFGPIEAKMSHAVTGQTFFCLMVCLALFTTARWQRPAERLASEHAGGLRVLSMVLFASIFIQLLVGALMRHTQSGLAIPDFPLSYGQVLPPLGEESLRQINADRFHEGLPSLTANQIFVHFAHRIWAGVLCVLAAFVGFKVFRHFRDLGGLLFPTVLLFLLIALQVGLGILIIFSGRQPHVATSHVALGAAILATSLVLCLESFHLVERGNAVEANGASRVSREAAT